MTGLASVTEEQMHPSVAKVVPSFIPRRPRAELYAQGKGLRSKCPRSSHAEWKPSHNRPDPVSLVEESDKGRIPQLIPLRHSRMLQSPFAFYRGAALNMAVDLAALPNTGIRVQCCGDAHLVNFRCFATPERRVIFAINDLDETLPAPWEWDIKRLAASLVIACRDNGLSETCAKDAVLSCARSYREHMAEFGDMRALELWYADLETEKLVEGIKDVEIRRRARRGLAKARERSIAEYDFPELVHKADEAVLIKDHPPTIYHWRARGKGELLEVIRDAFARYRQTLPPFRRVLIDRFHLQDIAIKVVGVGSVGTMCAVMLLTGGENDPLFLQVKEARASVLEAYAGRSIFPNHGQRVVNGQQVMQSVSDIFLGWTESKAGKHFYVRQLRDVKIKFAVEHFGAAEMLKFAEWCGNSLALSHARSGEPNLVSGYLGKGDSFDQALVIFATAYADQTERDYDAIAKAARNGRLKVWIERE